MPDLAKADEAIYDGLRSRALQLHRSDLPPEALRAVVMDWRVQTATATVLAAADGTASVYLSNGGGFIGGAQSEPKLRSAATHAIVLAQRLIPATPPQSSANLPPAGLVYFHFITGTGAYRAADTEARLRSGESYFAELGAAMQQVVSLYRIEHERSTQTTAPAAAATHGPGSAPTPASPAAEPTFWGRQDKFGRTVQGVCGAVLLLAAAFFFYFASTQNDSYDRGGGAFAGISCLVLSVRCFWYAFTGHDNVNLDRP